MTTPQGYRPGPTPNTVLAADGKPLTVPAGWTLLAPGDAALTLRVKAAGEYWQLVVKRGRRIISGGIYAPAATIERIRAELEVERSSATHTRKKVANAKRRHRIQEEYVEVFRAAVVRYLGFHSSHADLADRLAHAVTHHATPVGSDTVARTTRIPLEKRADAAVIAWMRHNTTEYDSMKIPQGNRRKVRREMAKRSLELLDRYRRGDPITESCPLRKALASVRDLNLGIE